MNSNQPVSEQFRLAAKDWVEKNSAADLLEESKSAVFAQMMGQHSSIPVNRAEIIVKGSEEWRDYVTKMVRAREAANLAKVRMEYIRMRFAEWNSEAANRRMEARL